MVSIIGGGGGRMDTEVAENAAGKRMIDGEPIQAESSESSSGHSDKDWIRYSNTRFQYVQIQVQLCSPVVCSICVGYLRVTQCTTSVTAVQLGSLRYGSIVNPATSYFAVYPASAQHALSIAEKNTHKQYTKALSWMSAQLSAPKGKGCC